MKLKVIIIVIILVGLTGGGIYYYKHSYVDTLLLSKIVGHSENNLVNIGVSLLDFDTGLTRHDIKQLNVRKEYWLARINQLAEIQDDGQKRQAAIQLLADFLDEPVVKRLKSKLLALSPESTLELIKTIFQN